VPWFRTYASDDIASSSWYGLTLAERGLLGTLARLTWIDGSAPASPRLLALAARASEDDVRRAFTDAVRAHLIPGPTAETIAVREIVRQRADVAEARQKMAIGGRAGAEKTNATRATSGKVNAARTAGRDVPCGLPRNVAAAHPAGSGRAPEMQCNALTSTPSTRDSEWIDAYEAGGAEHAHPSPSSSSYRVLLPEQVPNVRSVLSRVQRIAS